LSVSNYNSFRNKLPGNKIRKNLIILSFLGAFFGSTLYFYNYIVGAPEGTSDLPEIKILCEGELGTDEMIECTIEVDCKDKSECVDSIKAKIKIRGGGAGVSSYPKKGYRLKLSQEISLLGMKKEDDWNLYALYLDFSRIRIKFASDLWGSLKPSNPTAKSADSEFVSVYLNGEYQGLYLLSERYNRKFFGLEDAMNNVNSSLIFQAKGGCSFHHQKQGRWQQDWPNIYEGYEIIDQVLYEITNLITNTSNNLFFDSEQGIFSKFNKLNLIDFFIFNFFIDHRDFWNKNYYIVRNTYPNQFFLIPCDYDGCLGQYGWNFYDVESNFEQFIRSHNKLFNRLLDNKSFRQECKNRWIELRNILWTEDYLLNKIFDIYEKIKGEIELDTFIWYDTVQWYSKNDYKDNVDEYLENLIEYIPKRLEFCDKYFENLDSSN
jgi:hypothetical protein